MILNQDNPEEEIIEPLSKMTEGNKKQYIADVKVMNYLLQAIPNDIYNSVDACKNAKDMWERIKRLMFGSDVTSHVRHLRLMDEFDKFATKEGESLESVYERLATLVNKGKARKLHFYQNCSPEVLDNSAANTLDNENTSSSSIIIEEDEAPEIVSTSAEQVATEPNSSVLNENADELV
ncbi:hypothetical protein Tco_0749689 [Tanacetum coccineum]|uniref:Uncharacterized protein n=1 Tax=Tanacetum coccineum TaxID=301880 RepID=A0ABQ4Z263_9ASTR